MTAEIAILNKEGIALAADSAVTINTPSGRKIYNTVNKLFALTKYAPVGIMIYGRADFMGVPWESIIKVHRNVLGTKTFATLDQYASHFVSFLRHAENIFPTEVQADYFNHIARSSFLLIRTRAQESVQQLIAQKGKASKRAIQVAIDTAVEDYLKDLASKKLLPGVAAKRVTKIQRRYGRANDSIRDSIFQKLPLSKVAARRLSRVPAEVACRRVFGSDSGVVIAGFGENQIFPSVKSMVFGGVIDGILRCDALRNHAISRSHAAFILPFAQTEMVETFMEGVDPNCDKLIGSYWKTVIDQFSIDVAKALPTLTVAAQSTLKKKLRAAGKQILDGFHTKLRQYQRESHINPVIDAIAVLPKDLLAEVAESLVNLTSFKRRISMNSAETVGGPIDVAVISRGDGFVWIKRKHYFKPELNPQFMAPYWRRPNERGTTQSN